MSIKIWTEPPIVEVSLRNTGAVDLRIEKVEVYKEGWKGVSIPEKLKPLPAGGTASITVNFEDIITFEAGESYLVRVTVETGAGDKLTKTASAVARRP